MKKNNPKTKRNDIEDDNRTIANMNVEGMPWYMGKKASHSKKQLTQLQLTKRERRAMFLGLMEAMAPIAVIGMLLFIAVYAFLYFFWLG